MAKRPPKPTRYPRKFRQKLERMADERAERNGEQPRRDRTSLWFEFLGSETVEFMHGKVDDEHQDPRMHHLTLKHTLKVNRSKAAVNRRMIVRPPPWFDEASDDEEIPAL